MNREKNKKMKKKVSISAQHSFHLHLTAAGGMLEVFDVWAPQEVCVVFWNCENLIEKVYFRTCCFYPLSSLSAHLPVQLLLTRISVEKSRNKHDSISTREREKEMIFDPDTKQFNWRDDRWDFKEDKKALRDLSNARKQKYKTRHSKLSFDDDDDEPSTNETEWDLSAKNYQKSKAINISTESEVRVCDSVGGKMFSRFNFADHWSLALWISHSVFTSARHLEHLRFPFFENSNFHLFELSCSITIKKHEQREWKLFFFLLGQRKVKNEFSIFYARLCYFSTMIKYWQSISLMDVMLENSNNDEKFSVHQQVR